MLASAELERSVIAELWEMLAVYCLVELSP
jgi:hypothetical protein